MVDRAKCLDLCLEFIRSGNIEEAAKAGGTLVAYFSTLPGTGAQLAAMDDFRSELAKRCRDAGFSGEAEERHIVVEDVIEQARSTLKRAGMKPSPFV
jgi:hypothetical protein